MAGLLIYTLNTIPSENRQFLELLDKYNRACTYISDYAIDNQVFVNNALDSSTRELVNKKFRLCKGHAKLAAQHVSKDYHSLPVRKRGLAEFKPEYSDNLFVPYNKDTASLLMSALPVVHTSKFPIRLSIALTNDNKGCSRRSLFGFEVVFEEVNETEGSAAPTMRLQFAEHLDRWQFVVFIANPDYARFREELKDGLLVTESATEILWDERSATAPSEDIQEAFAPIPEEDTDEAYAPIPDEDLVPDPPIDDEEVD